MRHPLWGGFKSFIQLSRFQNTALPVLILLAVYGASSNTVKLAILSPLLAAIIAYVALHTVVTIGNDAADVDVDKLNGTPRFQQAVTAGHSTFLLAGSALSLVIAAVCAVWLPPLTNLLLIACLFIGWTYNNRPLQASRRPVASQLSLFATYGLLPALIGVSLTGNFSTAAVTLGICLAVGRGSLSLLKDYKDAAGDVRARKRTFLLAYGPKVIARLSAAMAFIGYAGSTAVLVMSANQNKLVVGAALAVVGGWLFWQRLRVLRTADYPRLNRLFHDFLRYELIFLVLAAAVALWRGSAAYYLQNFAAIFGGMVLFFLPFVAVFAYRNRQAMRGKNPHFNYFMERFFASRESNALIFTWAAAEALFWFIIPEFLLVLLIFMRVKRKFDLVKFDIYGTIAGTIIGLAWRLSESSFLRVPYVRPRMLDQVTAWYNEHGILGLLYQPFSGVPYKVFIHQAADYSFFIIGFLAIAIIARMARYVIIYEATKALFPLVHPFVRKHYGWLFVLAIGVFTFLLMHVVNVYG